MKRELERRPSLLILFGLVSGLTAFDNFLTLGLVIVGVWLGRSVPWRGAVVLAFLGGLALAPPAAKVDPGDKAFRAEATVLGTPQISTDSQYCEIEAGGNLYLFTAPRRPVLASGDQISIVGHQRPLSPRMVSAGAMRIYSASVFANSDGLKIYRTGAWLFRLGVSWREAFVGFVDRQLSPQTAAALKALCFNVDSDLDPELRQNLQRTGTIHIISASGLHVLIFALGLKFLFGLLPIPRGWQLMIIGAVLIVYAIGAGMKPPVIRSVAMAFVLGAASLMRREPDLLSALGATAVGYLLWRPVAIFDVGFQLSFAAVAGLGMFCTLPDERPSTAVARMGAGFAEVAKTSLVATLVTAPLTGYYFGTVSLVSVPANVLIAIALPAITLTAFAAHLLFGFLPSLSVGLMILLVQPLLGWVLWIVNTLGPLSFAAYSMPAFSAYWMLPYYGLMLLFWRPRARPA